MAEASRSKRNRDNLTGQAHVPQRETANDASTSPKPIAPPEGVALLHMLKGHTDWVRSVAWSPDGKQLASGSDDGTVRLWDTSTIGVQSPSLFSRQ